MTIEPLPEHLQSAAVALWHATGLTRPWNDPASDLHRALIGTSSTVLAAVDGERLLGTAMVGHDGHRGWIYYLAVVEDQQGRGLGRRLMQACERWLCDHDIPKIQLMVRRTNHAAVRFYERLGYTVSDVTVLSRWLDSEQQ